jgi:hypothetical protein
VRPSIKRVGIAAALVAFATTAHAAPGQGSVSRKPEAVSATVHAAVPADRTHAWMTNYVLQGLQAPAGASAAPAGGMAAEHKPPAKPHQNPFFQAGFVFQQNSALYLAITVPATPARALPHGS